MPADRPGPDPARKVLDVPGTASKPEVSDRWPGEHGRWFWVILVACLVVLGVLLFGGVFSRHSRPKGSWPGIRERSP